EALEEQAPELVHRCPSVEAPDEFVGRGIDAVLLAACLVGEQIPGLAAVSLPLDAYTAAQPRPQVAHAVPQRAEKGRVHAKLPPTTPRGAASRRGDAWRSRPASATPRGSSPRRASRGAASCRRLRARLPPRRSCVRRWRRRPGGASAR